MTGKSRSAHADALLRDFPQTPSGRVHIPEKLLEQCNGLFDNYIFYEPVGRRAKRFVCTACYRQWETDLTESYEDWIMGTDAERALARRVHGDVVACPHCGAEVQMRSLGRSLGRSKSRRSLDQTRHLLFLWAASKNLVYGAAAYVYKRYSDEYETLQLDYSPDVLYTFEPGESHSWRASPVNMGGGHREYNAFQEGQTTCVPFAVNIAFWSVQPVGLTEAVDNSFLRYCAYDKAVRFYNRNLCDYTDDYIPDEAYAGEKLVLWLADYCRYPQIEMLAKLDFIRLLGATVLAKRRYPRLLDWRAKTPQGFFRMSKAEFRQLAKNAGNINIDKLEAIQEARKLYPKLPCADILRYTEDYSDTDKTVAMLRLAKDAEISPTRMDSYLARQPCPDGRYYWTKASALTEYRDYIDMAGKLGYDLTQEVVRLPKNMSDAHDRAVAAYNAVKIEQGKDAGRELHEKLQKQFGYTGETFFIRAPYCAAEIIAEGQALRHCVAGYADRHCEGRTVILFLRRVDAPDTPLYTIEMDPVSGTQLRQLHGKGNKEPVDPARDAFVEEWLAWLKAGKDRRQGKIKTKTTSQTRERVTVAV